MKPSMYSTSIYWVATFKIPSVIHKDLLRAYCALGTIQRAEDTSVNNTHKNPCPVELIFYKGQKDSKHKKSKIGQWIKDNRY